MKGSSNLLLAIISLFIFPALGFGSATNVYITPDGSPQGACTTSPQTPSWFNNSANWGSGANQIGPGTTVTICGTFTGAAGSTEFTFQGSGASGQPITLLFDTNAVLQAPYWAPSGGGTGCGGAICMYNASYVTVDGGTNGIIENTANGSSLANKRDSVGINAWPCNNCTIRNVTIANIYQRTSNSDTSIDQTQMRCIEFAGVNWSIHDNVLHDSGWCLFQNYNNSDSNVSIYNNNIYNMDHGLMLATSSASSFTNEFFYSNQVHDTSNWDGSGCPYHHDGIHTFGTSGSSMSGIYVYNNYFYGNWGSCPTGFIFVEGGASSTPSNMSNSYWWNNVFVVSPSSAIVNTNGWVDIASNVSGVVKVYDNTIVGPNATDNTLCLGVEFSIGVTLENNVISPCGDPISVQGSTLSSSVIDDNFYGPSCQNGNNCFVWTNGSFLGSFSSWKSSCNCDSHAVQSNTPLLNSDGSPQSNSPVIGVGTNLTSIATGDLSSLTSSTTEGNTLSTTMRPASGSWVAGAYNAGSSAAPAPPSALTAIVK